MDDNDFFMMKLGSLGTYHATIAGSLSPYVVGHVCFQTKAAKTEKNLTIPSDAHVDVH
jgi:hypothetical protein